MPSLPWEITFVKCLSALQITFTALYQAKLGGPLTVSIIFQRLPLSGMKCVLSSA